MRKMFRACISAVPRTSNHHEIGIVKEETSDTHTNKDGIQFKSKF